MSAHEGERLSAWLDGELAAGESAAVEAHLARCASCREALAALRAVDPAARELDARAPDGYFRDFASRVRRRIEAEPPVRRRASWRPPAWSLAVAAALLLAVVTPLTWRESRTVRPERSAPVAPAPAATVASAPPLGAAASPSAERPAEAAPARRPRAEEPKPPPPPRQALMKAAPANRAQEAAPAATQEAGVTEGQPLAMQRAAVAVPTSAPPPPEPAPVGAAPQEVPRKDKRAAASLDAADAMTVSQKARMAPASAGMAGAGARPVDSADAAFQELDHVRPGDIASWRVLRERWQAFAAAHPASALADEARVRAIAAGLELVRLGAGAEDEARFRGDAEAYLAREDAPQKPRVRSLLEEGNALR